MRRPRRALRRLGVVGLAVAAALGIAGIAGAAGGSSSPITPVTTEAILPLSGLTGTATVPIVVSNAGPGADSVTPTVTIGGAPPEPPMRFTATTATAGCSEATTRTTVVLCPGLSVLSVEVTVHNARAFLGQVGLQDVSGTAVVQLDIRRSPPFRFFRDLLLLMGILALAVVGLTWLAVLIKGWTSRRYRFGLRAPLAAAADFKATDSWASTLTAIGAVLGTAVNLGGFFSSAAASVPVIAPGVSPVAFLVLNVVCGGLVLVAPALFAALPTTDRPEGEAPPKLFHRPTWRALVLEGELVRDGSGTDKRAVRLEIEQTAPTEHGAGPSRVEVELTGRLVSQGPDGAQVPETLHLKGQLLTQSRTPPGPKKTVGTVGGFLLASFLVVSAALLQLAGIYLLIWMTHPGGPLLEVLRWVVRGAVAVVAVYAVSTVSSGLQAGRTYDVTDAAAGPVRVAAMAPGTRSPEKSGKRVVLP